MRAVAPTPSAEQIRQRRTIALGIILGVVALSAGLLLGGTDERAADGGRKAVREAIAEATPRLSQELDRSGIELSWPKSWSRSKRSGAIQLTAPDRSASVAIASTEETGVSGAVLEAELSGIRSAYEDVEVRPGSGKRVGGLDSMGAVISARNRKGTPVRILVAVAQGKDRTYVVEVVTAENPPSKRLVESQLILEDLRLTG